MLLDRGGEAIERLLGCNQFFSTLCTLPDKSWSFVFHSFLVNVFLRKGVLNPVVAFFVSLPQCHLLLDTVFGGHLSVSRAFFKESL